VPVFSPPYGGLPNVVKSLGLLMKSTVEAGRCRRLAVKIPVMSTADLFVKIESLPAELRKEAEAFIDALLKRGRKRKPEHKPIPFGKFKGKIRMEDDFDAPLDDLKDYM